MDRRKATLAFEVENAAAVDGPPLALVQLVAQVRAAVYVPTLK